MADRIIFDDLTKRCGTKDANACLMLGRMYATGTIVARDDAAALRTFKKSCDLGDGSGCHALGTMHEKGKGTAASPTQASHYYQLACNRGNPQACAALKRVSAKTPSSFRLQDIFAPKTPAS